MRHVRHSDGMRGGSLGDEETAIGTRQTIATNRLPKELGSALEMGQFYLAKG